MKLNNHIPVVCAPEKLVSGEYTVTGRAAGRPSVPRTDWRSAPPCPLSCQEIGWCSPRCTWPRHTGGCYHLWCCCWYCGSCCCRGNYFHTNCSNVLLVSIGRSEMSYPKISKCPQMSINLPKCPKISNFPFKISKNLPKSQNVLSKIQNVLSKIQNVLSKIPKSNLVDVATTPANQ